MTLLAAPAVGEIDRLLETGIKVIDVMCPLIAGGTLPIASEYGAVQTFFFRAAEGPWSADRLDERRSAEKGEVQRRHNRRGR